MRLIPESDNPQDYLGEIPGIIEFHTPKVQEKIREIEGRTAAPMERARLAFEVARDEIVHAFDVPAKEVSISAEETLERCQGICFAKSHLLAALLRGMGIPAGFCYQRVLRKGTPGSGFALHGLNALHFEDVGWFRVDPRGNKPGIDSQFSVRPERLAYPIRPEWGEVDYPNIFITPRPSVLEAMRGARDSGELFACRPESL